MEPVQHTKSSEVSAAARATQDHNDEREGAPVSGAVVPAEADPLSHLVQEQSALQALHKRAPRIMDDPDFEGESRDPVLQVDKDDEGPRPAAAEPTTLQRVATTSDESIPGNASPASERGLVSDRLPHATDADVTDEWARRRKRTRSSPELAEGDIELLREAGVVIPERQLHPGGRRSRRRRRLRQAADLEMTSENDDDENDKIEASPDTTSVAPFGMIGDRDEADRAAGAVDAQKFTSVGEKQASLPASPHQAANAPVGASGLGAGIGGTDDQNLADEASIDRNSEIEEEEIGSDDDEDDLADFIDYGDGAAGQRRRRLARERARAALQASLRGGRLSSELDPYAAALLRELFGDADSLENYRGEPLLYHDDPEQIRKWLQRIGVNDPRDIENVLSLESWAVPEPSSAEEDASTGAEASKSAGHESLSVEQTELLAEMYATPQDDAIRALDLPEYTQLYHCGRDQAGNPLPRELMDESDIRYEAEWIVTNGLVDLLRSSRQAAPESSLVDQVAHLLRFLHLEHLDIAFIAMYRRDYLEPDLLPPLERGTGEQQAPVLESPTHFVGDWTRLWRVLDWDRYYFQFLQQKRRLMDVYEEQGEEELLQLATAAFRREMLQDVEKYARLRRELAHGDKNGSASASAGREEAASPESLRQVAAETLLAPSTDAYQRQEHRTAAAAAAEAANGSIHPEVGLDSEAAGTVSDDAMDQLQQATAAAALRHASDDEEHRDAAPVHSTETLTPTIGNAEAMQPRARAKNSNSSSSNSRSDLQRTNAEIATSAEQPGTLQPRQVHPQAPGRRRAGRTPSRRDALHVAISWVVAHQLDVEALYGIKAADLASNVLSGGSLITEPADHPNKPSLEELLRSTDVTESTAAVGIERYLRYVRQVAGALYAAHPRLRHFTRTRLREKAHLTVKPSARALQDLDILDPLRPYCSVEALPVAALDPAEMARFIYAERLGLVEHMECSLAAPDEAELESILERALLSDKLYESAQVWNAARRQMLTEQLLRVWLLPPLLAELLECLREEARGACALAAVSALEQQLVIGGASPSSASTNAHEPGAFGVLSGTAAGGVLAFVVSDESEYPTTRSRWIFGVALDAYGQVLDTLRLGCHGWLPGDERLLGQLVAAQQAKSGGAAAAAAAAAGASALEMPPQVRSRLERFLQRHPHRQCVAIGVASGSPIGVNAASLWLYEWIRGIEQRLGSRREQAVGLQPHVLRIDDDAARLYAKTKTLSASLGGMVPPECDGLPLRRAVGVARLCQEPLAVYAAIATEASLGALLRLTVRCRPQHQQQQQQQQQMLDSTRRTDETGDTTATADAAGHDATSWQQVTDPSLHTQLDLGLDGMVTSPSDRLLVVERALRHAVASLGLDLNLLLRYRHLQPLMAFAPGLGVRKASLFIQTLRNQFSRGATRPPSVPSRQAVLRSKAATRRVLDSLIAYLRVSSGIHGTTSGGPGATGEASTTLQGASAAAYARERLAQWRRRASSVDVSTWRPLDETRIHPVDEPLAMKIVVESLREHDPRYWNAERLASTPAAVLVLHLLEHPEAIEELDLPGYAAHLEQAGHGRKRHILFLIANEFYRPFADWRLTRSSLQGKALFYACTDLDECLFGYGTRVHAFDGRPVERGSAWRCRVVPATASVASDWLPGRLEAAQVPAVWRQVRQAATWGSMWPASVHARAEERSFGTPSVAALGQVPLLPLRVKAVDGEALQVQLMALEPLPAELAWLAERMAHLPGRVPLESVSRSAPPGTTAGTAGVDAFNTSSAAAAAAATNHLSSSTLLSQRASRVLPTGLLRHPAYRALSGRQVVQELAQAPPGTVYYRPCSRDAQAVCASFKIHDEAPIVHLDLLVVESAGSGSGAVAGNATGASAGAAPAAAGSGEHVTQQWQLRLDAELFDDLDEVFARYIEPIVQLAWRATQHPKFMLVGEHDNAAAATTALEALLRQEKAKAPSTIPYRLAFCRHRPAHLVFAYLPGRATVLYEPITLTPTGYRLRDQVFSSVDDLVSWFKRNWQRLLRSQTGPPRQQATDADSDAVLASLGAGAVAVGASAGNRYQSEASAAYGAQVGVDQRVPVVGSLVQLAQRALERSGAGTGRHAPR
jgi:hypothetical protein